MVKYSIIIILIFTSCFITEKKKGTPIVYKNKVKVNNYLYSKDSIGLIENLYCKMKNNEESFSNSEYNDFTILLIDTIIYDSSLDKIALFVVAKIPKSSNPYSDTKLPYYYNANCYIGKRKNKNLNYFDLKCLCKFYEINFDDKETVVKALKEDFFIEMATVLDENNNPVFKYNLDDVRFWTSSTGWNRMFE